MEKLLEVKNLSTSFFTHAGEVKAVRNISFDLARGEALGIVGESGSGKSVSMFSVMRLLTETGKIVNGNVMFDNQDVAALKEKDMKLIRGNNISMIFQDPMTSLNPVLKIGTQMIEALRLHKGMNKQEAKKVSIDMLRVVGIPSPEKRINQYPHEFSGGMRQRVMIAMALSCQPKLLIADEPTTALDVTIQAQILEILKDLREKLNTSIILITHDLGIVADLCDKVNVMYGGCIVESGRTRDIFNNSKHPYTWGLLDSVPNPKTLAKERLRPIDGQPPDLLNPPKGCPFAPRCSYAMEICLNRMPEEFSISPTQKASCWLNHPLAPKLSREERR